MADIEQALLQQLAESGTVADSGDFAKAVQQDHLKVVGTIKSLEAAEMIVVEVSSWLRTVATAHMTATMRSAVRLQDISHSRYVLTAEAEAYLTAGSPEVQLFNAVPADGISLAQLKVQPNPDLATRS